jgi:hypothetical protein
MRSLIVFRKTMREIGRDKWMLGLTLAFAPFFVFLYWLWFQGGSTVYPIAIINHDQGVILPDGSTYNAGNEVGKAIAAVHYVDGRPLLKVVAIDDKAAAEAILRDRGATAFLEIPGDFSQTLLSMQSGDRMVTTSLTFGGDLSNTYYMIGANMALTTVDTFVQKTTGQTPLVNYIELPLDTMNRKERVVSDKLRSTHTKGEAYDSRNDHQKSVYSNSTAPLHCI